MELTTRVTSIPTDSATPPKSIKSTKSTSSVQLQIKSKSQVQFVGGTAQRNELQPVAFGVAVQHSRFI